MGKNIEQEIWIMRGVAEDLMNDWVDDRNRIDVKANRLDIVDTISRLQFLLKEMESYNES